MPPKIAILTIAVGGDYRKAMEAGIKSKQLYAEKHGYDFILGGNESWERSKPIPWSKLNFINKYIDEYDYIFCSDADAIILNTDISLENQVIPLLPLGKDLLWTFDACSHYNSGHMLFRGRSTWLKDYFQRVNNQDDLTYHIWYENAAMIRLYEANPNDKAHIETCKEHWLFNSYIFGPKDTATDPSTRLYKPGDFLIHFAGVYEPWNIYRMMLYAQLQHQRNQPLNPTLLDSWRHKAPHTKRLADESFQSIL